MLPESSHVHRLIWYSFIAFVFATLVILLAANGNFLNELSITDTPPPPVTPGFDASSIRVTIDFGNGTVREFRGEYTEGMSAFRALSLSADVAGLSVIPDTKGRVANIGGFSEDEKSWHFYVNGEVMNGVPGDFDVRPGDQLAFRYE